MQTRIQARIARANDEATAQPELKTVAADMPSRRIFANTDDATNYLAQAFSTYSDIESIDLAARGVTFGENGPEWDSEIYGEETGAGVMVAKLKRNDKGGKIKALVISPTFTVEQILAAPGGREWLQKTVETQLNHIAVRVLRNADDVSAVVDQMPATLSAFLTAGAGAGSGILETWNNLFKDINKALGDKVGAWKRASLVKKDFRKALENRGFALAYYPALENRGEGKDSLFVRALNLGIRAAKDQGMDPTIFERWKENRNTAAFTPEDEDEDEDDFDLDDLAAQMSEKPADESAPATVTEDEDADA